MRGQLNEFFTFINTSKAASETALDVFFYDEKKKQIGEDTSPQTLTGQMVHLSIFFTTEIRCHKAMNEIRQTQFNEG